MSPVNAYNLQTKLKLSLQSIMKLLKQKLKIMMIAQMIQIMKTFHVGVMIMIITTLMSIFLRRKDLPEVESQNQQTMKAMMEEGGREEHWCHPKKP